MAHQFALIQDSNTNVYKEDKSYKRKNIPYDYVLNINNNYGKRFTNEYIEDDGIDIIPKSGILVNGRNSNECFDLFIACLYGLFFSFEFVHSGH
jgi:hypothetical protein